MSIRKYITKKNVIIGAAVGTAVIGGIVALVVNHNKRKAKREYEEFLKEEDDFDLDYLDDDYDDYDEDFWDEDLDDDDDEEEVSPQLAERIFRYHDAAERLLKELENGIYGK